MKEEEEDKKYSKKEENIYRIKGLLRLGRRKKTLVSISGVFGVILSIASFVITELRLGYKFLLIFVFLFIAVFTVIIRTLQIENKAVKTLIKYLEYTIEQCKNKLDVSSLLIDRSILFSHKNISGSLKHDLSWEQTCSSTQHSAPFKCLEQGIEINAHILIEGEMGIGKTVLANSFTKHLAEKTIEYIKEKEYKEVSVPILIPLRKGKNLIPANLRDKKLIDNVYQEWLRIVICSFPSEIDRKDRNFLYDFIVEIFKDLTHFTLIFDAYDEFVDRNDYAGLLSPRTLFKSETKEEIWKGAVILTTRPGTLKKLNEQILGEYDQQIDGGYFSLRDHVNPFAYVKIPKFNIEDCWRYIEQGRPILKGMEKREFFDYRANKWSAVFGDDWRIPLYLWALSFYEYPEDERFPKTKRHLFDSIFDLHFGWYYRKMDIDPHMGERFSVEINRLYLTDKNPHTFEILGESFKVELKEFHEWQKDTLSSLALFLSLEGRNRLTEKEFESFISEKNLLYWNCLKQSIREGEYIICSSSSDDYFFSPGRMQEMFAAHRILSFSEEETSNALKTLLSRYYFNKDTLKTFIEFMDIQSLDSLKEIFLEVLPTMNHLLDFLINNAENTDKLISNILDRIEVTKKDDILFINKIDLSKMNLQDLGKIELKPIGRINKIQNLSLSWNSLKNINLSSIESCTELESLSIDNNRLTEIDLKPLKTLKKLKFLDLEENFLKEIDLSNLVQNSNLDFFYYENTEIFVQDLKKGDFSFEKRETNLICDKKYKNKIQSQALFNIKDRIKFK